MNVEREEQKLIAKKVEAVAMGWTVTADLLDAQLHQIAKRYGKGKWGTRLDLTSRREYESVDEAT